MLLKRTLIIIIYRKPVHLFEQVSYISTNPTTPVFDDGLLYQLNDPYVLEHDKIVRSP
jgi:hypothetical protein